MTMAKQSTILAFRSSMNHAFMTALFAADCQTLNHYLKVTDFSITIISNLEQVGDTARAALH